MTDVPLAETKEEKKQAKEYGKRLDRVLKELQKKFKPKSLVDRMPYNLMLGQFRGEIKKVVSQVMPSETKKSLEILISRLLWVIEEVEKEHD